MLPAVIRQEDAVKNLDRLVGVEGRTDLGDPVKVAVDEGAQPAIVVDRARPRAPAHVKLVSRDAERVLDVDREEADPEPVGGGRPDAPLPGPPLRLNGPL